MILKSKKLKIFYLIPVFFIIQVFNSFLYASIDFAWAKKTDKPTVSKNSGAAVLDNKIYAIGGNVGQWGVAISTVEIYDPDKNTWATGKSLNQAIGNVAAGVINNKIYAVGSTEVEVYDPATNSWQSKSSVPEGRSSNQLGIIGDKIYITANNKIYMYDTNQDTWTVKAILSVQRESIGLAVVNNKVYVMGGQYFYYAKIGAMSTVEEYDLLTDTLTVKANMLKTKYGFAAIVINNKIYVIGGTSSASGYPYSVFDVEEYDPTTNAWVNKTGYYNGNYASVFVNNKVYILGNGELIVGIIATDGIIPASSLAQSVKIYPNPCRTGLTFSGVSGDRIILGSTIRIYGLGLKLLKSITINQASDSYTWNLVDEAGEKVSPGIYFYTIENSAGKSKGKFTVIK